MALKKRERVLIGVTGSLIVVLAGMYLFTGKGSKLSELRTQRDNLKKEVEELTIKARPGRRAAKRLDQWRKRSLPSNVDIASAEYGQWLSKLAVDRIGRNASIKPYSDRPHRGIYTALPFKIEGRGSLDRLTRFLFEFESAGYLHTVRSLTSTPIEGSEELQLVINVEGLSLPGAAHQDRLPTGQPSRLEHAELKEYLNAIVRRRMEGERFVDSGGLFASYVPQRTVAPPPKVVQGPPPPRVRPSFDPSAHTKVSAIIAVDGVPEVWLLIRTEGRTLYLREGDPFEVGTIHGTIKRIRIGERDVELEIDGRRWLVALDDTLQQRVELPGASAAGGPASGPGSDLQGAVFMRPPQ